MDADTPPAEPAVAAERIRVYVVEDQSKILKNQLKLLESSLELEIVGTALSGEAALDDVKRLLSRSLSWFFKIFDWSSTT